MENTEVFKLRILRKKIGDFYFLARLKESVENYSFVKLFLSKDNPKEYFRSDEVLIIREKLTGLGYEVQISNVKVQGRNHKTLDIIIKEN